MTAMRDGVELFGGPADGAEIPRPLPSVQAVERPGGSVYTDAGIRSTMGIYRNQAGLNTDGSPTFRWEYVGCRLA